MKFPTDWRLPVGYLQSGKELNLRPPKANPSSSREEDLNLGALDYKSNEHSNFQPVPPPLTFLSD